jgi:hypothetical protein
MNLLREFVQPALDWLLWMIFLLFVCLTASSVFIITLWFMLTIWRAVLV